MGWTFETQACASCGAEHVFAERKATYGAMGRESVAYACRRCGAKLRPVLVPEEGDFEVHLKEQLPASLRRLQSPTVRDHLSRAWEAWRDNPLWWVASVLLTALAIIVAIVLTA